MYHWRGDCGLLDRLSWGESGEIPRNWKMTSLDPATVQARIESGPPVHFSQPTDVLPLSDQPVDDNENDPEAPDGTQPKSRSEFSASSSVAGATAASRAAPKPKRHELPIEVSNCDRRRIDKKKIVHGNNKFGRKGNLRCIPCRNRKIKVNRSQNRKTRVLIEI